MSKDNWPAAHKGQNVVYNSPGGVEYAAIVLDVHPDKTCSVRVFSPNGTNSDMQISSVKYIAHWQDAALGEQCCFPPRGW